MKLRINILVTTVLAMLLIGISYGQEQPKKLDFYNEEFKWKITIPENFKRVSEEEWLKTQNKGAEAFEKTYDTKMENRSKTIFVFKSDDFHFIEANTQPFDSATDGSYLESFHGVNQMIYGTFEAQLPDAKMDTASSTETIDGLLFYTFKISMTLPNKMVLEMKMFSRLFGKKEFTVNIMTLDRAREQILLEAFRNSKFDKPR